MVEAGDIWETHHYATLIGYGANAVNPYLVLDTVRNIHNSKLISKELTPEEAERNYIKAIGGGLLKIFSKMGISTLQSYHGAHHNVLHLKGCSCIIHKPSHSSIQRFPFWNIATVEPIKNNRAAHLI